MAKWLNPVYGSFDDFGSAMLILYVASTGDGWDELMFATMDATEPGKAPVRNDFSPAALFSIIWIFVGCFFALNLFVGVIVDNFNRIKAEDDGTATMTPEQLQWVSTDLLTKAIASPGKFRKFQAVLLGEEAVNAEAVALVAHNKATDTARCFLVRRL